MKPLATLALAATATIVACSAKPSHPGAAVECTTGIDCTGIGGPVGGGGPGGTGSDASTVGDGAVTEGGLAVLSVNGRVTASSAFSQDPASFPLDSADSTLYVQAYQNVTLVNAPVTSGIFTFTNIDNDSPNLTPFVLWGRNTAVGGISQLTILYAFIDGATKTVDPLTIPYFDPATVTALAVSNGVPTTAEQNAGTVVYQIHDSAGAPIAGAHAPNPSEPDAGTAPTFCPVAPTGGNTGPCGPLYDSGTDVEQGSGGTGSRGTIMYLAVPVGSFTLNVVLPSGSNFTFPPLTVANQAVTFVRVSLASR